MSRDRVIGAYLDRLRPLLEVEGFRVGRHAIEAVADSRDGDDNDREVFVADVTGTIEIHGAAAEPMRWRDVFTFTVVVELGDVDTGPNSDPDEISLACSDAMDVCVHAISACWDPNDTRTRLVEPGAESINATGPRPVAPDAVTSGWIVTGTLEITIARHLHPQEAETP